MKQINKTKSLAIALQSSLEKAERSSKSSLQYQERLAMSLNLIEQQKRTNELLEELLAIARRVTCDGGSVFTTACG